MGNLTGNVTGNLTGNVTGLVNGLDIREVYNGFDGFDFGYITQIVKTFPQLYLTTNLIDLGSFVSPLSITIDGGTII